MKRKLRSYSETGRLRSKGLNFNNFLREPPVDGKLLSEKKLEEESSNEVRPHSNSLKTMRCPFCQQENDKVADTRTSVDGSVVRRRRECCDCGRKFTTYEKVEATQIRVIKRDGSRVPFDRGRLQQGIERACWKRKVSDEQIEVLISQVEHDINTTFNTEVESRYIGEQVMHYLGKLDQVAYVRFASVYRHFESAEDFARELQRMSQNPEMPSLSVECVPKKQLSRVPKRKSNRYKEGEENTLPLE